MSQETCGCQPPTEGPMPEVTFSTFILSLASSALVQLGEVPNPETGRLEQDLLLARHNIDVLDMLRQKTSRCLEEEERRLLDGILYELRMKYVIKCGPDCKKTCGEHA
ncbi:DUF1844 domain-containing protein [Desulfovibrio sp. ZJ200]|uniref:DUF1844 domain-containing protein n=1 Tax=Desulfovibrio sp. ZJ200 TaxID=2709792 RepID=UPI0013EA5D13|nr:DUF1844 domain-containing protein [Desulfovibrio sp. ZJ200]